LPQFRKVDGLALVTSLGEYPAGREHIVARAFSSALCERSSRVAPRASRHRSVTVQPEKSTKSSITIARHVHRELQNRSCAGRRPEIRRSLLALAWLGGIAGRHAESQLATLSRSS